METNGNRAYQVNGRADAPVAIDWTPASGPMAGKTLKNGLIEKHPQHGDVVRFPKTHNKGQSQDVTAVVGTKPDLAALVSQAKELQAKAKAAKQAEADRINAQAKRYLIGTDEGYQLGWAAPVPESERGRYKEEVRDRILVPATKPGVTGIRHTHPGLEAIRARSTPGMFGHNSSALWEISEDEWNRIASESREHNEGVRTAKEDKARAKTEASVKQRSDALALAKQTGQRQQIRRWTENVEGDDENSLNVVIEYALPDGTTKITRSPTH